MTWEHFFVGQVWNVFNMDDDMNLKLNYQAETLSLCFGSKRKRRHLDKWLPMLLICMTKKKKEKMRQHQTSLAPPSLGTSGD